MGSIGDVLSRSDYFSRGYPHKVTKATSALHDNVSIPKIFSVIPEDLRLPISQLNIYITGWFWKLALQQCGTVRRLRDIGE